MHPLILPWQTIADHYRDGLIVANGGSIAVHAGFSYRSLYAAAQARGYLRGGVSEVFAGFETEDFELVLRRLWHATLVNRALQLPQGQIEAAYDGVRDALIRTVRDVHVNYETALPHLTPIYRFLQRFHTVISLNYDLIVYWAAMLGNQNLGNWFKDAFHGATFDDEWTRYRSHYGAMGSTLLFYPHGDLVLAQARNDNEIKLRAGSDRDLLSAIIGRWTESRGVPLFVCEGTTTQKQQAIRASHYLNAVYAGPLHELGDTVVVYGWGMAEQDDHIIKALATSRPTRIAVSVYGGNRDFVEWGMRRLRGITGRIDFFDAGSPGCWNNVT